MTLWSAEGNELMHVVPTPELELIRGWMEHERREMLGIGAPGLMGRPKQSAATSEAVRSYIRGAAPVSRAASASPPTNPNHPKLAAIVGPLEGPPPSPATRPRSGYRKPIGSGRG